MNADEIQTGMAIRVTTHREVGGRDWHGSMGVVADISDRDEVEDWVYVRIPDSGLVWIGFRPDEIEPA